MKIALLLLLLATCLAASGCGGNAGGPASAAAKSTSQAHTRAAATAYATARARLAGMRCASVGLRGGAAIGHYHLFVCAGPDHANLGVPSGAFVCWGFHDFGLGHEQPAVELNLLDASGKTIGGHVYPDTTLNCQRTLKVVAGLL